MEENLLKGVEKSEAYASLKRNTGWLFLEKQLNKKKKQLKNSFKTIDPEDSIKIAQQQAKLNLINEILRKPDYHSK